MKAEDKVKRMFPEAFLTEGYWGAYIPKYRVTIMDGRYAYGRMKSWAWTSALESIQEDEELTKAARKPCDVCWLSYDHRLGCPKRYPLRKGITK